MFYRFRINNYFNIPTNKTKQKKEWGSHQSPRPAATLMINQS
nr:MAG TPA: hypothetical protein [Caudoviricetes sp.]